MAKKRPYARVDRLGSQVKEILATALLRETREAILRGIVITDVEVTSDVSLARVYWHALPGAAEDREAVEAALARANRFLRAKVGEVVRARITPELRFLHDDALDRGRRIEDVLRTIASERPADEVTTDAADGDEDVEADGDVEADDASSDSSDDAS